MALPARQLVAHAAETARPDAEQRVRRVFVFDPINNVCVIGVPRFATEESKLVGVGHMRASRLVRIQARGTVPALRRDQDAARVQVAALLAPAGEGRRWRQWLRQGTPARRAAAAVALCAREQTKVVLLIQNVLLTDGSPWVRRHAGHALGLLSGRSVARALVHVLAAEQDPHVRGVLLAGLGRQPMGSPGVRKILAAHATQGHGVARASALLALEAHGAVELDVLEAALTSGCVETRRAAVAVAHQHAPHLLPGMWLDAEPTVARLAGAAV